VLIAAALSIATAAWARTFTLRATTIDPSATGSVDAKTDKTGQNVNLLIKVDHLVSPTLLTPRAVAYVVWVEPPNGPPRNVGTLMVGENEKGELKTATAAGNFVILITAETNPQPQTPSDRVVLRN
jgi:hypothetical protein